MEKRDILMALINHYCNGKKSAFAEMLGIAPRNITAWLKRNTFNVELISTQCRDVNPAFLLTGEGPITLDAGVSTPSASPTAPAQQLNNTNLDLRINELMTISTNLYEMFREVNSRMAEATAIITKSQQQFDRVLNLYEQKQIDHTTLGMVSEQITIK